jgi:drug/metabolite transporter (DMT)-like permease
MNWLIFALMTVVSWGLYGIFLHSGQVAMKDQSNGLFKAFLFVGLAYFLTAVLAPLAMLAIRKTDWIFPPAGMGWSLLAGIVGAAGAFCVLLAFSSKGMVFGTRGTPTVVMSIVFAGAPIVNAVVAMISNPPAGGWGKVRWQFYLGIVLAAAGGCMVTYFKPPSATPHAPAPQAAATVKAAPTQ